MCSSISYEKELFNTKHGVDCTHQACYRLCLAVSSRKHHNLLPKTDENIGILALNIYPQFQTVVLVFRINYSALIRSISIVFYRCVFVCHVHTWCGYIERTYTFTEKKEPTYYARIANPKTYCPFIC